MNLKEDLTKSGHVNVRWQAQMEEHLEAIRQGTKIGGDPVKACAHGLAAIALAVANTVGDLELPLSKMANAVERMGE